MRDGNFEAGFQKLIDRYLAEAPSDVNKTNMDSGHAFLDLVLQRERLRYGVTQPGQDRDRIDAQTIATLEKQTKLGPEYSFTESAFRRLSTDPEAAAGYVEVKVEAHKLRQSQIAEKERPRAWDSITRLLEGIVERETSKTPAKVVGRRLEEDPNIELVEDVYRHRDGSTLRVVNLPSRLLETRNRRRK
jgi:hypothetical protein